jgi:extracellular elastinolytic metalloproteinase
MFRRLIVTLSCAAALSAVLPAWSAGTSKHATEPVPARAENLTRYVDVRADRLSAPNAAATTAVARLARAVRDLRVTWNGRTGTVKVVESSAGTLTGPSRAPAERIARDWIAGHRDLFGLAPGAELKLARNASLPGTGLRPLVFRQHYGAIPTFNGGSIGVNVMADGRIVSVWGDTGPTGRLASKPRISAADALRSAARFEGARIDPVLRGQRSGGDRLAIFAPGAGPYPNNVRLVAFPTASGPRLAWRVFYAKAGEEMLVTVVDATTGKVLTRTNQVQHEGETGLVVENYPGAPRGGTQVEVSFDGDPAASPRGWVGFPTASGQTIPSITTAGNNIFAFTDWLWPKLGGAGLAALQLIQLNPIPDSMPIAADGSFDFPFENNWGKDCTPILIEAPGGDPVLVENPNYVKDREASVTNLFFLLNRMHDLSFRLGFDEAMGNFQQHNFAKGGKEFDAVRGMAMASVAVSSLNNAFMFTPGDGGEPTQFLDPNQPDRIASYIPPFTGIFMTRPETGWEAPCGDLDMEASTVWHEYTHGITNRTVGDPNTADGLNGQQSGAMGEAWSDWFATHFLQVLDLDPRDVVGGGVDGNLVTGYRNYRLDANPKTYADYGYGLRGPEVHNDGEIWTATLWDLREALVAKYGRRGGEERAGHLVYDALALSASAPTFLTMRDSILAADKARYASANRAMIWRVFAKRGMGVSAKTKDASDNHPVPGFDVPGANTTVSGVVTDADGGTIAAKIVIGTAEGVVNPVVVTKSDGKFSIKLAAGTYPLTVSAPGYGFQRFGTLTVGASGTIVRSLVLAKNLASAGYGAKVISGIEGSGLALIDGLESSRQTVAVGTPVVIQLAGTGPATLSAVSVSPRVRGATVIPTDFSVEVSLDAKTWRRVGRSGVRKGTPFTIADRYNRLLAAARGIKARFVRVTVLQTTGSDSSALAEVQVFGSAPGVVPVAMAGSAPFVEQADVTLANPGADTASITLAAWQAACAKPVSPIQGLDSYMVEFPEAVAAGLHEMKITNAGGTATDLDVYFYGADCTTVTGAIATGAADESGLIPAGTRWAQITLFAGTTDGFEVKATSTLEAVRGPTKVGGVKITNPAPRPDLPATGVGETVMPALLFLAGALLLRRIVSARS